MVQQLLHDHGCQYCAARGSVLHDLLPGKHAVDLGWLLLCRFHHRLAGPDLRHFHFRESYRRYRRWWYLDAVTGARHPAHVQETPRSVYRADKCCMDYSYSFPFSAMRSQVPRSANVVPQGFTIGLSTGAIVFGALLGTIGWVSIRDARPAYRGSPSNQAAEGIVSISIARRSPRGDRGLL